MEYQQMPQQMPIGPPTPSPSPHLQLLQNGQHILPSMVPPQSQPHQQQQQQLHHQQQQGVGLPNMPLQLVHLPNQIGLQNPSNIPANNMPMPPPATTNGHHMQQQQQQHNGHHNPHSNNHNHNAQSLPPPNQILQQIHQNAAGINGGGGIVGPGGGAQLTPAGVVNGVDANNNAVGGGGGPDEGNRWFQVQQLWRHHAYLNGKSGNSKDICGDDKHKEDGDPWNEAQAAFLGPNLWDKTLPYDADLKVHQYVDLDEFLSENNIPVDVNNIGNGAGIGQRSESISQSNGLAGLPTKREKRSPSPSECVSPDTMNPPSPADSTFSFTSSGREFDPRSRAISDEDMKPQPMVKKSRKQFVPEDMKDDKYWARRRKNNIAAKRSRDARRQKENQIALRARYLEKENMGLQQEVDQLRQENLELRARLSKYQDV